MVQKQHARRKARRESSAVALLKFTGWVPFACALAVLLLTALASITWITSPSWGNNAQAKARNVGVVPTQQQQQPEVSPVADIVSPNRIEIPKIHADAPIVKVGTNPQGELDVPLNPRTVGWWQYGAKPGATVGTAILAGHINYAGVTGAMAEIGQLDPGDQVYVFGKQNADNQHEVQFTVTGVRTYHKTALPYKEIFDQQSVGRIAIVTCGGPFDAATGNYLDNIVVFAVPAGETPIGLAGTPPPGSPLPGPSSGASSSGSIPSSSHS